VGNLVIKNALLDLGACVSIMPGSLYDTFDFGPLQKVNTTALLADQTPKRPRGIVRDVRVKVSDFYYPVDFLVLDSDHRVANPQHTVILGRPFLATADTIINCADGTVRMKFGGLEMRLNVFSNWINPPVMGESFKVETNDECVSHESERSTTGEVVSVNRVDLVRNEEVWKKKAKKSKKKRKKNKKPPRDEGRKGQVNGPTWKKPVNGQHKKTQANMRENEVKHPTRPP
jgi:hypothetical protein